MSKNDPLNEFRPFVGMTVVLGGDFRKILSIVRKGTRQDIVDASVNSSKIWAYCNVLRLTEIGCIFGTCRAGRNC